MGFKHFTTTAAFAALVGLTTSQKATWMTDMNSASSDYGFTLYDSTIFQIMWPGAADIGMYDAAITTGTIETSNSFGKALNDAGLSSALQKAWSTRQWGTVEEQLNYGARFLHMSFVYDSGDDEYYSYQGLRGATASTIANDIDTFLTANPDEFLILYFNNFIESSNKATELTNLWSIFTTAINSNRFADSGDSWDFTTDSLSTLMAGNSGNLRIILLSDEDPDSNTFVYDANTYLTTYDDTDVYTLSNVRTAIIGAVREGWDVDTMFITDRRLRFDNTSDSFTDDDSWFDFTRGINYALNTFVNKYPKLRLGNVILTDFISASDVTEQIIILNYNYHLCNDLDSKWGTDDLDCPSLTNLKNSYYFDSIQDECENGTASFYSSCMRSCGACPYISGVPGSSCENDACDSEIYQAAFGGNGVCFEPTNETKSYTGSEAYCISTTPVDACASIDEEDYCTDGVDTSLCSRGCASDYQCESGYCSSEYGVCLSFNYSDIVADTTTTEAPDGYDQVLSETAIQFRDDIAWLRPGDPDASYSADFNDIASPLDALDKNPYITSVVGFILVPFILSLFLFSCWFITCVFWCCPCCEGCCKRCCCKMCLGGNPDDNAMAKWTPCGILAATIIVVIWACIEGIIYNTSMHEHVFATNSTQSVRSEMDDLFDDVVNRLGDVTPDVQTLVDDVFDIVNTLTDDLSTLTDVDDLVSNISSAFGSLSSQYAQPISFTATVRDPFTYTSINRSLDCSYCTEVADVITELNQTISTLLRDAALELSKALNQTSTITALNQSITQALSQLDDIVGYFVNQTEGIRSDATEYFDLAEPYDEQREYAGFIFFTVPFVWIVFPILGIFLGKWCFKVNWCLAMFLGATVMLILSIFSFVTVLWADLCVRLDDFETNLASSDIGTQLTDALGANETEFFFDLLDTCLYGGSILEIFNLTNMLDFDGVSDTLISTVSDYDLTDILDDVDFDDFLTQLDLLDTSTFSDVTDENLNYLNSLNTAKCFCPINNATNGVAFTRSRILNFDCSNDRALERNVSSPDYNEKDEYWISLEDAVLLSGNTSSVEALCYNYYIFAFSYTFAETELTNQTQSLVNGIKESGDKINTAFNELVDYATDIFNTIIDAICDIANVISSADSFIAEYSTCTFVGDAYEGFKTVGCELLFTDMYSISRSMAVIAFMSIMVVYCSMCMDYVKDPASDDEEDDYDGQTFGGGGGGNKKAVGSSTDPYSDNNTEMVSSRPSYAAGMHEPGQTAGPGSEGQNTHFV